MVHRLVLVDDEPRNLDVLEAGLAGLRVEPVRFTDGHTALAAMIDHPPDLVLLDLVMPGFDGLDVLAHLRANPSLADVPVVLVTGHTDRDRRQRGVEAGADEFVERPVDPVILKTRVRALLQRKTQHDELLAARHALRATNAILERRSDALASARQAQRELLSFVVDDVKAPLTTASAVLERGAARVAGESPRLHEVWRQALTSVHRADAMLDDLIATVLLEDDRLPLRSEPLQVGDLLEAAATACLHTAAARDVDVAIEPAGEALVTGDRAILVRVLHHVLDDAARFTPAGGRIAVGIHSAEDVTIVVSSTAPAMPPEDRARIFEKLTHDGGRGGLALHFCRRALASQRGTIAVLDRSGWPTSFQLTLPSVAHGD